MSDDQRVAALRDACTRWLSWHGRPAAADLLAQLPDTIEIDRYGEGGVVAELERTIAELLGKPAAVFMPSGTMAQQIALRIHADRRGRRTVAFHPTCHLELHEGKAFERLHRLVGRPIGDARRLLTLDDLREVAEPVAAVLWELPQREIGGQLPAWDDLVGQVTWAAEHGAATHLDGARLWECTPHYGRGHAEIAALFDTVYVSFYKGLGALAGCCLAGPGDLIAEAREWRTRHGGTLFGLWPNAASALACLRRLDRMPGYVAHARAIAGALRTLPGVAIVPDPPVTPMMHLYLRTTPDAFRATVLRIADEQKLWIGRERSAPTDRPDWQVIELVVGDATLDFSPDEVRALVAELVSPETDSRS